MRTGFLTYEHRIDPADVVYSRNALLQIPDAWKAIAVTRVAAMLRPRGLLRLRDLVSSFEPGQVDVSSYLAVNRRERRALRRTSGAPP